MVGFHSLLSKLSDRSLTTRQLRRGATVLLPPAAHLVLTKNREQLHADSQMSLTNALSKQKA